MKKKHSFAAILALLLLVALVWLASERGKNSSKSWIPRSERGRRNILSAIWDDYDEKGNYREFHIDYPGDGTLFPPEIIAPTFRWTDERSSSDAWAIKVEFSGGAEPVAAITGQSHWRPEREVWETIKNRSLAKKARVTIVGLRWSGNCRIQSRAQIEMSTSRDKVASPIFYRDVPLPFIDALRNLTQLKWRLGDISREGRPPAVLENMPVCGNCHSFSTDGKVMGMDVDYANDKGSYVITPVASDMVFSQDKVITWSDYKRNEGDPTFGLLSQISPDGRYVISTVKDQSVFVPKPGIMFSQLFFPVKGILAVHDRQTGEFKELPGADDPNYVQSNPVWSPDGKTIVFARSKAQPLAVDPKRGHGVLASSEQSQVYVDRRKLFKFDLYRIPFNKGKGGHAEPIPGASHNGMSNYFAKFSPDGKWIVFCRAESFMLLQPDSELYIIPVSGGEPRRMNCNLSRMNSWHSWSPEGKWLVFSSKANSAYTQLFLTHIDEGGNDTPPVLLENFTAGQRAANIPEFVNIGLGGITRIHERFVDEYSYRRLGLEQMVYFQDYDRASEYFRQALALNPKDAAAHANLGQVMLKKGEQDEAQHEFELALKLDPSDAVAHNNLGTVYFSKGSYDAARQEFVLAVQYDPDEANYSNNLARVLLRQNQYDQALESLDSALHLDADTATAHYLLGIAHLGLGRMDQAQEELETALRLDVSHSQAHYSLGEVYRQKKLYDQAQFEYQVALQGTPDYPEAHEKLGKVLLIKGDHIEAQRAFETSLRLSPDNVEAHFGLAALYAVRRDYPAAEKHCRAVLMLQPTHVGAQHHLGHLFALQGHYLQAQKEMNLALELDPNNVTVRYSLAKVYSVTKDYARARQEFRMILELDPKNAGACFGLAGLLGAEGRKVSEALELANKGLQLDPSSFEGRIILGNLYARRGQIELAIEQFEEAVKLNPAQVDSLTDMINNLKQKK